MNITKVKLNDLASVVFTFNQQVSSLSDWEVLLRKDVDYDYANNCQIVTYCRICSEANTALALEIIVNWLAMMFPYNPDDVAGFGRGNERHVYHHNDEKYMDTQFPVMIVRKSGDLNHDVTQYRWRGTCFEEIV